jgi:hypothetical protein
VLCPVCQLCNFSCFLYQYLIEMAANQKEKIRSRSPKQSNAPGQASGEQIPIDEATKKMHADIWAKFEPELDKKNESFKETIKGVVGAMVNQEVSRLETKLDANQVRNDEKFVSLENKIDTKFESFEAKMLQAINSQSTSRPAPGPSQGSAGGQSSGGFDVPMQNASAPPSYAAVAGGQPPFPGNDVTTPSFNRRLDPTKLFCNIHEKVQIAKSSFLEAVGVLVLESGLKESDFELQGDPLDFRFEMQFLGDLRTASVKTKQFHDSLYLGRGKFKDQFAKDDQGVSHKFYVSADKNPAQIRKEVLAKRLQTIISPMCPGKEMGVKKASGSVTVDRRVLVSVQLTGEESARLNWCHAKRIELKIEQEAVEQAFGHFVVSGGPGS